jgi:hypothetical protein
LTNQFVASILFLVMIATTTQTKFQRATACVGQVRVVRRYQRICQQAIPRGGPDS